MGLFIGTQFIKGKIHMNFESILKDIDGGALLKTLKQYELVNINSTQFEVKSILSKSINRNFKISDGEQTLLLKVFNKNNKLPISRSKVFALQEELAILGLAPLPLFLNDENTIYCEQWIAFTKYKHHDLVRLLADSLYSVHNSFVSAPLLALDEHWEAYWQQIESPSTELQDQYELVKKQWHNYKDKCRDQFVLCHNDLHSDHLSYTNGPLFDWEYAGLGCRYFDIASCCAINQLSEAQTVELCKNYADLANQNVDEVLNSVTFASGLVSFTYELWDRSLRLSENLQ